MSTTPRCHRLLQWAAEDLTDPAICRDPERLDWKRQAVINWLTPDIDEVVELAWRQLQADQQPVAAGKPTQPARPTSAPPICVDCRYYRAAPVGDRFDMCQSPETGFDLVRGKPVCRPCENMRSNSTQCGEAGQWFEAAIASDGLQTQTLQDPEQGLPASLEPLGLSADDGQKLQAWLTTPLFSPAEAL